MAWACTSNNCPSSVFFLGFGTWCWTIWYDTIYGCQDKSDDVKAGIKSTAVLFGSGVKIYLAHFGAVFITCLALAGAYNNQDIGFYMVSVVGGAIHLVWQLRNVDTQVPASCWRTFYSNGFYFGSLVEAGLLLDYFFQQ